MFEGLELLFKYVNRLIDEIDKSSQKEFNMFVDEIYCMTEEIYTNFSETLQYAYSSVKSNKMTVDEVVVYFDDSRLPFKAARAKVRGRVKVSVK